MVLGITGDGTHRSKVLDLDPAETDLENFEVEKSGAQRREEKEKKKEKEKKIKNNKKKNK